jgi:hypothetical protein
MRVSLRQIGHILVNITTKYLPFLLYCLLLTVYVIRNTRKLSAHKFKYLYLHVIPMIPVGFFFYIYASRQVLGPSELPAHWLCGYPGQEAST